jgi:hypothetical protein
MEKTIIPKTKNTMSDLDYLNLAKEQFNNLQKETLDMDRYSLGGEDEINYEIDGVKFKIKVDGFWEKSVWFDWFVYNEQGIEITKGYYVY